MQGAKEVPVTHVAQDRLLMVDLNSCGVAKADHAKLAATLRSRTGVHAVHLSYSGWLHIAYAFPNLSQDKRTEAVDDLTNAIKRAVEHKLNMTLATT